MALNWKPCNECKSLYDYTIHRTGFTKKVKDPEANSLRFGVTHSDEFTHEEKIEIDRLYFKFLCEQVVMEDKIFNREKQKHYLRLDDGQLQKCDCECESTVLFLDVNGFSVHS